MFGVIKVTSSFSDFNRNIPKIVHSTDHQLCQLSNINKINILYTYFVSTKSSRNNPQ
jgi:hypothetical protein